MGKGMLLVVGALTLAFSTVLYSVQMSTKDSEVDTYQHATKSLAREVALSGVNEGIQNVFEDFRKQGITGPNKTSKLSGTYKDGIYQVEIERVGKVAHISSTAVMVYDKATKIEYNVKRSYIYDPPAPGGQIPPFMNQSITCDGNIIIKDKFRVKHPTENTNMHANGNIIINPTTPSAMVTGYGYHAGNLEINNGQTAMDIFQPNIATAGKPVTEKVAKINIPLFKADDYKAKATTITNKDVNLSGTVTLGTKDNPSIWFVTGNVKTTGPVNFVGHGIMVVKGNFDIEHDMITEENLRSTFGLYIEGNITVKKPSLNMAGQWFVHGNVQLQADTRFTGTITNDGNCLFDKHFNITYKEASPVLTAPLWAGSIAVGQVAEAMKLSSSQEWAAVLKDYPTTP